eukprot:1935241-Rhodomonas_salina.3
MHDPDTANFTRTHAAPPQGVERHAEMQARCAICLRARYTMSGTDIAYGANRKPTDLSLLTEELACAIPQVYLPTRALCDARY